MPTQHFAIGRLALSIGLIADPIRSGRGQIKGGDILGHFNRRIPAAIIEADLAPAGRRAIVATPIPQIEYLANPALADDRRISDAQRPQITIADLAPE